jgi:hypothetical protein
MERHLSESGFAPGDFFKIASGGGPLRRAEKELFKYARPSGFCKRSRLCPTPRLLAQ